MQFPESKFYVSLSHTLTPVDAHDILDRLANDDDLRSRIESNARETFLELGIDFGEELAPAEARLPHPDEIRRVVAAIQEAEEFQVHLDPFGPYVPGKRPFIALLLLAAAAAL